MEINEYLLKLMLVAKDMEQLGVFGENASLSKTEFRLVREIVMEGKLGNKIISSELARRLGITRSAVSQLVNKMEEREIVKRVDSLTDKKIAYIQLSDKALAQFDEQCRTANELMARVAEVFGEERMHALIAEYDEFAATFERVVREQGNSAR
jgi:DNA-binding MarR family transcriptional regulator